VVPSAAATVVLLYYFHAILSINLNGFLLFFGGDYLFINRLERLMKKLIAPRCQRIPC
jgi:hypothetical protein